MALLDPQEPKESELRNWGDRNFLVLESYRTMGSISLSLADEQEETKTPRRNRCVYGERDDIRGLGKFS